MKKRELGIIPRVPHGIMFHHFRDQKHFSAQGAITADQLAMNRPGYSGDLFV